MHRQEAGSGARGGEDGSHCVMTRLPLGRWNSLEMAAAQPWGCAQGPGLDRVAPTVPSMVSVLGHTQKRKKRRGGGSQVSPLPGLAGPRSHSPRTLAPPRR